MHITAEGADDAEDSRAHHLRPALSAVYNLRAQFQMPDPNRCPASRGRADLPDGTVSVRLTEVISEQHHRLPG